MNPFTDLLCRFLVGFVGCIIALAFLFEMIGAKLKAASHDEWRSQLRIIGRWIAVSTVEFVALVVVCLVVARVDMHWSVELAIMFASAFTVGYLVIFPGWRKTEETIEHVDYRKAAGHHH